MNKETKVRNLLITANLIELGQGALAQLAGGVLDGNIMNDNAKIFEKELNRRIMENVVND